LQQTAPSFSIFNVRKNPTERSDSEAVWSLDAACVAGGGAEACGDLFGDLDYSLVQTALLNQWAAYRDAALPSEAALSFADDGPLADPSLFGGYWASWRDEAGVPYATYATSEAFAGKLAEKASSSSSAAAAVGSSSTTSTSSASASDGRSDGSGDKSWKANKDLAAGQSGQGLAAQAQPQPPRLAATEAPAARLAAASAHSQSASSPALLLSAGSVIGALGALALQTAFGKYRQRAGPPKRDASYAALRTEEA
jgi:hypothetical protein